MKIIFQGKFAEATHCYNKCSELKPEEVAIYANRAQCYLSINEVQPYLFVCLFFLFLTCPVVVIVLTPYDPGYT